MHRLLFAASLGLFALLLTAAELNSGGQSTDGSSYGDITSAGEGAARRLAAAARSRGQTLSNDLPPPQCVSYSGGDRVQLLSASTGEVVGWASLGAAAPPYTSADDPLLPNVTAPGYSSQASRLAQRNSTYTGVFRNPRMRFNVSLLSGRLFAGAAAAPASSGGSGAGALLSNSNSNNGGGQQRGASGVHQLTAAVRDPGAANLRAYTFTDQPSSCPIAEMHFAQEAALPCAATWAAVDVDLPALFGCSADANGGQPFSLGLFLQLSVRTTTGPASRACAAGANAGWGWAFGQEAPAEVAGSGGAVVVEVEAGVEQRPECAFFEVVATCNPAACAEASPPPPSPEPWPPRPRRNMPVADGTTRTAPPAPSVPAPLSPPAVPVAPAPPSPRPPPRRTPGASGGARAPPMPPFPVVDFDPSASPPQYPPLSAADGPIAADVRAPPPSPAPSPSPAETRPSPAPAPASPTSNPVPQSPPSTPATASGSAHPPAAPSPESPELVISFMPPPPHRTTEGGGFGGGATGTTVGGGGFGPTRTATVSGTTDGSAAAAITGDGGSGGGTMKPMAIAGVAAGAVVASVAVIGVAALVISGKVAALFAATGSSALAAITAGAGVTGASAASAAGTVAPAVGFATGGGASAAAAAAAAAGRDGWYFAIGRRSTNGSEASSEADPHSTRVSMNGAYDGAGGAAAASSPGGASTATASSGHTACSGQEPMVAMLMASISLPLANDGRQELW